jgi:hypothetical protein
MNAREREMEREQCRLSAEANDALSAADPDTISDEDLATLYIARLTAHQRAFGRLICLSIDRAEPYCAVNPRGTKHSDPWPIRFDWKRKNCIGIKTKDYAEAIRWGVEAYALGFDVVASWKTGWLTGPCGGTLTEIRERLREQRARDLAQDFRELGID